MSSVGFLSLWEVFAQLRIASVVRSAFYERNRVGSSPPFVCRGRQKFISHFISSAHAALPAGRHAACWFFAIRIHHQSWLFRRLHMADGAIRLFSFQHDTEHSANNYNNNWLTQRQTGKVFSLTLIFNGVVGLTGYESSYCIFNIEAILLFEFEGTLLFSSR